MAVTLNHHHFLTLFWIINILCITIISTNDCSFKTTCSDCIQAGSQCAWCTKNDTSLLAKDRCNTENYWIGQCNGQFQFPKNEFTYIRKDDLSEPKATVENIVQLWPQKVQIKARPMTPQKFEVKFRQAEDYPVDLYFLMDLSFSMNDDKANLASLGTKLGTEMGKITKNFRLGYGSFVDKKVAPFVSMLPSKLESPCGGCAAPYGFINHMPLSTDVNKFVTEVTKSQISGNLDTPEGGFDAIMQAIVCNKEIGWRNVSRKILLVATDAGFHFAGDGKLGGIVTPNDEKCHLDSKGLYTESTNMDYPSISQIKVNAIKNHVHIIFAVTTETLHIYDELQKLIEGSYAGKLAKDSSNIVELVREQYMQISSTVELKDNSQNFIQVNYFSKCTENQRLSPIATKTCKNLKLGTEVTFDVELTVTKCPANYKDEIYTFEISPVGLSETLVVDVQLSCDCQCERDGQKNSHHCTNAGTYECGICDCNTDRRGSMCQCGIKKEINQTDASLCQMTEDSIACSARGRCVCGECVCHRAPKVYGPYCECEDVCTPDMNGRICGGPSRGACQCGKCKCYTGWIGDNCECRSSNASCFGNDGVYCSNKGECVCGQCKCNKDFDGPLCETSLALKCHNYSNCAYCIAFPELSKKQELICEGCIPEAFEVQKVVEILDEKQEFRCRMEDKDGCLYYFVYTNNFENSERQIKTRVQSERECPEPVNALVISVSVIGAIVAIGLALLLLWKILTTIYDRREYAKFVDNCQNAKWEKGENPTYVPSTSTYANPMYSTDN
ncbi:hypothetical protein CHUAL_011311 [Chamberlinius hualienensis]